MIQLPVLLGVYFAYVLCVFVISIRDIDPVLYMTDELYKEEFLEKAVDRSRIPIYIGSGVMFILIILN